MFDWWDYLAIAIAMAGQSDEAARRSAISRAYYAAFGSARAWLRENQAGVLIPVDGQAHRAVWNAFQSGAGGNQNRVVGQWGTRLRRLRNQADYQDDLPNLAQDVVAALRLAQSVKQRL